MEEKRNNKKYVLWLVTIIIIAGLGYWLASPLFIDKEVTEAAPQTKTQFIEGGNSNENTADKMPSSLTTSQGYFKGRAGHSAAGTASVIETGDKKYIRFEGDFSVTNGPDLFVYLGKDGSYNSDASLGALKGNKGSQNYEVPEDLNLDNFNEVWVWCRAFSVPFGVAVL